MNDVIIRPASFQDSRFLARMKLLTAEGISEHMWRWLAGPDCDPMAFGQSRVENRDTQIAWTKGWIADHAGVAVGGTLCDVLPADPQPIPPGEDPMWVPMQELENLAPETATILILAVEVGFRRQGIGARLLSHADSLAGPRGLSATISDANSSALRLLERSGYTELARRPMHKGAWKNDGTHWLLYTKPGA